MRVKIASAAVLAALLVPAVAAATHEDPAGPNDPLYGSQWGPQQLHAEQAWHNSTGAGAVIAVIDSGVDLAHEDLAGRTVAGKTFLSSYDESCGEQGCGNGDWRSGPPESGADPHGTHVAGIAAAATDNRIGIAGIARGAQIMPIKALGVDGGALEDVARGIRYAADNGADVVNLSTGGLPGVQALVVTGLITDVQDAIDYARSKGVVVIAAAGNEAFPICDTPGFDRGVVCVTATDRREVRAAYSNEPINEQLSGVAAPGGSGLPLCGEDVLSTVPAGKGSAGTAVACGYPSNSAYDEYAGTSMSAPHAAGVAALLAAQGCSGDAIVSLLETTSRQPVIGARGVYTPLYGYGIVDAEAATAAAKTICAAAAGGGTTEPPRQSSTPAPRLGASATPATFGAKTLLTLRLAQSGIRSKGPLPVLLANANGFAVSGELSGETTKRVSVDKPLLRRRRLKLRAKAFRVPSNAKQTVTLELSKKLRRLLTREGKLSLRISATVKDPAGNTRTVRSTVKPKVAKGRRRPRAT